MIADAIRIKNKYHPVIKFSDKESYIFHEVPYTDEKQATLFAEDTVELVRVKLRALGARPVFTC